MAKKRSIPKGFDDEETQYFKKGGLMPLAIAVTIKNTGDTATEVYWGGFRLIDKDGIEYDSSLVASGSLPYFSKSILQPGNDAGGWVPFEVPSDTVLSSLSIRYEGGGVRSNSGRIP